MMLIASVAIIFLSILLDVFGRKKVFMITSLSVVLGCGLVCFSDLLSVKMIGLTLLWTFSEFNFVVLSLLSNELLVNPFRHYSNNTYSIFLCIGGLAGNFLTHYIRTYKQMVWVYFWGYSVAILLVYWFIPYSPSFLLKKGAYQELTLLIEHIGKRNGLSSLQLAQATSDLESVIKCRNLFLT